MRRRLPSFAGRWLTAQGAALADIGASPVAARAAATDAPTTFHGALAPSRPADDRGPIHAPLAAIRRDPLAA